MCVITALYSISNEKFTMDKVLFSLSWILGYIVVITNIFAKIYYSLRLLNTSPLPHCDMELL